eukprot:1140318-Pelagomonas_calceolata.AAC.3
MKEDLHGEATYCSGMWRFTGHNPLHSSAVLQKAQSSRSHHSFNLAAYNPFTSDDLLKTLQPQKKPQRNQLSLLDFMHVPAYLNN